MKIKMQWASRLSTTRPTAGHASFAKAVLLLAILWATTFVAPLASAQDGPPLAGFALDRILVKPKSGTDLTALHDALGTAVIRSYPAIGDCRSCNCLKALP